jgi:hypothetical protein
VLKESGRWLVDLAYYHVVQDCAYCKEPFCSLAKVVQTLLIKENFLDNESGHCLRELCTSLHDSQAQRDYFSLEKKADHFRIIHFDQGSYDT